MTMLWRGTDSWMDIQCALLLLLLPLLVLVAQLCTLCCCCCCSLACSTVCVPGQQKCTFRQYLTISKYLWLMWMKKDARTMNGWNQSNGEKRIRWFFFFCICSADLNNDNPTHCCIFPFLFGNSNNNMYYLVVMWWMRDRCSQLSFAFGFFLLIWCFFLFVGALLPDISLLIKRIWRVFVQPIPRAFAFILFAALRICIHYPLLHPSIPVLFSASSPHTHTHISNHQLKCIPSTRTTTTRFRCTHIYIHAARNVASVNWSQPNQCTKSYQWILIDPI